MAPKAREPEGGPGAQNSQGGKTAARSRHLEALLNSTLDGILVIDENQQVILFNRAAEDLFRCPASKALGAPLDRFVPEGTRAKHRGLVEQYGHSAATSRTMRTPALSLTCLRSDGTEFIGEISISRHMHEGKPTYAAIIRDITARVEAERLHAERETSWRSLFENMLEAVARGRVEYADGQPVDWQYLEVNPAFERLTGLANVVGKKVSELIPGFREANQEMLAQFASVAATGAPQTVESYVPGLERWFKISAYRPKPGEFIAVFDNITERKQAEREREALLEIMQGAASTGNLQDFLSLVRQSLSRILPAQNLFVVLYDERSGNFEEVFAVDKYDAPMPPAALEKSITSYVFRTGEALLLTQATFEELSRRGEVELVGNDSASWLGAPLRTANGVIGVIAVQDYDRPDAYTERDRDFLASVAAEVALALQRKRAEDQLRQRADEQQALYEISLDVMGEMSFDQLLTSIVQRAASLLGTDGGALYLMEPDGRAVRLAVIHNFPRSFIGSRLKLGEGISGAVAQTGEPMQVADYASWSGRSEAWEGVQVRRVLAIPLRANDELIGVIDVSDTSEAGQFSEQEIKLGGLFANQAAMVIQRSRAEEALRQSEASLRIAEELAHLGSWSANFASGEITGSDEAYRIFGLEPQSVRLITSDVLGRIHPEDRQAVAQALEVAVAGGPAYELEYRIVRPDAAVRWILTRGAITFDDAGKPVRLLGSVLDITERKEAQERVRQQLQHVSALREIDRTIIGTVDLRVTLSTVITHAMRELGLDAACVLLLDPTMQTLRSAGAAGFRTQELRRIQIPARGGFAARLAAGSGLNRNTGPLATESVFAGRPEFKAEGIVTCFAVPLMVKGEFKGVMEAYLRRPFTPDSEWLDFLSVVGGQIAVAIDSASLFEQLQRSNNDMLLAYDETIEGWSRALDLRDKETEGHTQRVTKMTIELARSFGLSGEQLVHVRRGALLHDIGKLGVPDSILLKAGVLTDEEWVLMKKHPTFAYDMLAPIDYLRPALDIPWCHHEKWDGSGYPRGLAGETIPLEARIFSVVDVWDALRSDRPYRPRWSEQRVIEHISTLSGKDFDPRVVTEFLSREPWKSVR